MQTQANQWDTWEAKAKSMTISQLHYAILDCCKAAEAMDELDRVDGQDRAGRYRDECSIYRTEMRRR